MAAQSLGWCRYVCRRRIVNVIATLGVTGAVLLASAVALWLVSLPLRDASIVDRFWGSYFALTAAVTLALVESVTPRGILLTGLATVWGLRLSVYLSWRNWGQGEDYRYQAMRRHWGARFWWVSLFTVFVLQAVFAWFISLPLQIGVTRSESPLNVLDYVGAGIWLAGFAVESVGDLQLARFKADPTNAGKVMDRGLWRYTRHPNYFGDAVQWWGLYVIAVSAPGGIWTVLSPIFMTYLLMRVSGVPMLERKLKKTRPEYADYAERTSSFFPKPPKMTASVSDALGSDRASTRHQDDQ
jgi:steroid 5-alpha reductase family enzyme